jgi:hypothetical protein
MLHALGRCGAACAAPVPQVRLRRGENADKCKEQLPDLRHMLLACRADRRSGLSTQGWRRSCTFPRQRPAASLQHAPPRTTGLAGRPPPG